jgi:uncharacterized membrane protein YfcA
LIPKFAWDSVEGIANFGIGTREGALRQFRIARRAVTRDFLTMSTLLLVAAAGILASVMNAAAGGGTFVTFPALVLAGVPPVSASMSSTIALWPGMVASAWAYRQDFKPFGEVGLPGLLIASLLGGGTGATLLLLTPAKTFDVVVPWLLLLATLTLAFGRRAGDLLRRHVHIGPHALIIIQFVLAAYGGYFTGAVGIMMMAAWTLLSTADIRAMNSARTMLVSSSNAVAVMFFLVGGDVWRKETAAMLVGTMIGGYFGARAARRLNPRILRMVVIVCTAGVTLAFFVRAYGFRP